MTECPTCRVTDRLAFDLAVAYHERYKARRALARVRERDATYWATKLRRRYPDAAQHLMDLAANARERAWRSE